MKKRILSLLLALVLLVGLLPTVALAADGDPQVHVIVENTTFTKATDASNGKAPAWTGTLIDTWVDLKSDSTMMTCVEAALDGPNIPSVAYGNIHKIRFNM